MEAIKQPDGTWDIEGLEPWQDTFEHICFMLRNNVNFKFARYGDGEIFCMNGKIGRNCDKHEYFPDLGLALHDALKRADYLVGIQPLSVSQNLHKDYFDGLNLYNADVLHNASIKGRLGEFVQAYKDRYVIMVGPSHLVSPKFNDCVLVPDLNCWSDYNNISFRLERALGIANNPVVLLCASMMSEVLIDRFRDEDITMIDCGSVFDPYAGVKSRRYHQTLNV